MPSSNLKFTPKALCAIIGACAEAKVKRFALDGLVIDFGDPAIDAEQNPSPSLATDPEEIQKRNLEAEKLAAFELLKDNQKFEDEQADTLMLTDPEAYEEKLMRGDFEDEKTHSSGLD